MRLSALPKRPLGVFTALLLKEELNCRAPFCHWQANCYVSRCSLSATIRGLLLPWWAGSEATKDATRTLQGRFSMMNHGFGWMGGPGSIWAVLAVLVVIVVVINKLF